MAKRKDDYEDLVAENAALASRLDQITGITKALGDDAKENQLQDALDEIYGLAAPDDELEDSEFEDDDLTLDDEDE